MKTAIFCVCTDGVEFANKQVLREVLVAALSFFTRQRRAGGIAETANDEPAQQFGHGEGGKGESKSSRHVEQGNLFPLPVFGGETACSCNVSVFRIRMRVAFAATRWH
jgi:hypothetical protein